ncbi:MAG: PAS domain S-box protein [Alphaproteobacteria bacterium]|nr:PAS domain S-box protein [Alphaproteobacteria bacterium]
MLETALNCMAQGLIVFDADLTILASNRHASRLLDMPQKMLRPGLSFEAVVRFAAARGDYGPGDPEPYVEKYLAIARGAKSSSFQRRLPNGATLSVRNQPMPDGGCVVTYTDVSERRKVQVELFRQKQLFEAIFRDDPDPLILADQDGTIVMCNPAVLDAFRFREQELVGNHIEALFGEEHAARLLAMKPSDNFDPYVTDYRRKDQTTFTGEAVSKAIAGVGDEMLGFLTHIRDVTVREKAEAALRASESRLANAQRIARLGNWDWSMESDEVWCSEEGYRILGLDPAAGHATLEALTGQLHPDDKAVFKGAIEQAISARKPLAIDLRLVGPGDGQRVIHMHGELIRNEAGVVVRLTGTVQDITERALVEALNTRLGRIIEHSVYEIYVFDAKSLHFVQANRGARENLGYMMDELARLTPLDLKPDFSRARFEEMLGPLRDGREQQLSFETTHRRKDGSVYPVEVHLQYMAHETPQVFVAAVRDISERSAAQAALRESEAKLANAQRIAGLGNWDWITATGEVQCSEQGCRILGLDPAAAAIDFEQFLHAGHEDDREVLQRAIERAFANKDSFSMDYRVVPASGDERIVQIQGEPVFNDDGSPVRMTGTLQDITEQKRAERELRVSDSRLRRQNEVLGRLAKKLSIAASDLKGALRNISEAGCRTLAVERVGIWLLDQDIETIRCLDLYELSADRHSHGMELATLENARFFTALEVDRTISANEAQHDPLTRSLAADYLIPNGITSLLSAPVYVGGELVGLISHEHIGAAREWALEEQNFAATLADMVSLVIETRDRQKAEQRLRLAQFSIDRAGDSIFWLDAGGQFIYANETACRELGYARDELLKLTISAIAPEISPRDWPKQWERLKASGSLTFEAVHRTKDGRLFPVEVANNYLEFDGREYWCVIARDISERKSTEERLRQGQKMEALGQLAGGVAHEFNNILTSIGGFARMALAKPDDSERVRECLKEVTAACGRASSLTRQMLTFSHKQVLEPKVMRIGAVIKDMEKLLSTCLDETIHLGLEISGEDVCAKVDPTSLTQSIVNLAINARHAMPDGGDLTVGCEPMALRAPMVSRHGDELPPGDYVRIFVTDQGTGIDNETLLHIFEPFFTTKDTGSGTGLGLSLVYGMVRNSGGVVDVESTVGAGTTFSIYLPVVDEDPADEGQKAEEESAAPVTGAETILVVEDDRQLRTFVRAVLEQQGFTVLTAKNGVAALEVFEAHQDKVDALVTDVVMPEMGGLELAERLTGTHPELKVLYMTGYAPELTEHLDKLRDDITVLRKPFEPEAISRVVREVLDS